MTDLNITIGDERAEQVSEFVYLVFISTRNGVREDDVQIRVQAGNKVNGVLRVYLCTMVCLSHRILGMVEVARK